MKNVFNSFWSPHALSLSKQHVYSGWGDRKSVNYKILELQIQSIHTLLEEF
jgi:hypothetical protein